MFRLSIIVVPRTGNREQVMARAGANHSGLRRDATKARARRLPYLRGFEAGIGPLAGKPGGSSIISCACQRS
jgi:hypothetical protein